MSTPGKTASSPAPAPTEHPDRSSTTEIASERRGPMRWLGRIASSIARPKRMIENSQPTVDTISASTESDIVAASAGASSSSSITAPTSRSETVSNDVQISSIPMDPTVSDPDYIESSMPVNSELRKSQSSVQSDNSDQTLLIPVDSDTNIRTDASNSRFITTVESESTNNVSSVTINFPLNGNSPSQPPIQPVTLPPPPLQQSSSLLNTTQPPPPPLPIPTTRQTHRPSQRPTALQPTTRPTPAPATPPTPTQTTSPETPPFLRHLLASYSPPPHPRSRFRDRRNAVDYSAALDTARSIREISQAIPPVPAPPLQRTRPSWDGPENPWPVDDPRTNSGNWGRPGGSGERTTRGERLAEGYEVSRVSAMAGLFEVWNRMQRERSGVEEERRWLAEGGLQLGRGETGARSLSGSEVLLLNRYRNERGEEHEDGLETRLARNENRVGGQSSSPRRFMLDSHLNDSTHTERVVARITNIRAMIRPTTPSVALPPMTRTTNTGRRPSIQTQPQLQTHIEIHPQPQSDVDDEMPSLLTRSSTANSEISTSQTTPFDPVALFERYLNQHIDNEKQPTPTNTQSSGLRKNSCHPTNLPTLTLRSLQQLRALGSLNNTRVSLTIPRERHQRIMYLNGKSHTFIDEMPDLKLLETENDQLKWQAGEQGHAIRCSGTGLVKLLDVNGCPVAPASWEHVDLVMKVLCSGGSSSTGFEGGARRSSEAGSGAERGVRSREREVEGRSQRRRLQRREGGEWALIEEAN